jgi:hypothetical protein
MNDQALRYTLEINDTSFEIQSLGAIEEVFGSQQVFTPELIPNTTQVNQNPKEQRNPGVLTKSDPTGRLIPEGILDGKAARSPLTISLSADTIADPDSIAFFADLKKTRDKFDAILRLTVSYSIGVFIKLERCLVSALSFGDSRDPTLVVELVFENLETDYLKIGESHCQGNFRKSNVDLKYSLEFGSGKVDGCHYIELRPYFLTGPVSFVGGHGANVGVGPYESQSTQQSGDHDLEQPKDRFPPPYRGVALEFIVSTPFSTTVDTGVLHKNDTMAFLQKLFMGLSYFSLNYRKAVEATHVSGITNSLFKNYFTKGPEKKVTLPFAYQAFDLPETLQSGSMRQKESVVENKVIDFHSWLHLGKDPGFLTKTTERTLEGWIDSMVDNLPLYPQILKIDLVGPHTGANPFYVLQDLVIKGFAFSKTDSDLNSLSVRLNLISVPDFEKSTV